MMTSRASQEWVVTVLPLFHFVGFISCLVAFPFPAFVFYHM